jgi:hypothetical protein
MWLCSAHKFKYAKRNLRGLESKLPVYNLTQLIDRFVFVDIKLLKSDSRRASIFLPTWWELLEPAFVWMIELSEADAVTDWPLTGYSVPENGHHLGQKMPHSSKTSSRASACCH